MKCSVSLYTCFFARIAFRLLTKAVFRYCIGRPNLKQERVTEVMVKFDLSNFEPSNGQI
jgi:hypothetical protein